MLKRILIVDDEELFLQSLQEGLESLSHVFQTDICFSVNEAIKCVITRKYDLVITDMRMPEKSGLELLVYLREIKYEGKVIVMSAYNTDENQQAIRSYGVVDIISKPFNFEWFKKKLVETLTAREAGKEKLVTFESIDLVTVLQIVNLERKTSALEIDLDDRKGIIYFEDGEIINAQYGSLQGEKAVLKLIVDTQHQGAISVKAIQGTVKRIMQEPFVEHMMKIMKTIDELRQDQLQDLEPEPVREMEPIRETDADAAPFPETGREPKAEVPISPGNNPGATPAASEFNLGPELVMDTKMPSAPEHNVSPGTLSENKNDGKNGTADQASLNKKKEVRMTINEKLAVLKDVKGYLGAGVFTPQGEMLEGVADISGVQFEEAGSLIHDTLKDAKDMAKEIGFGNLDMIQLYTQIGIVFAKCYNEGDKHFHTILVIKNDGNMAMARLKMKKVVDSLISEF